MATLGSLYVSLEANIAKFVSDMGRAQHVAEQNMRKINEAAETVKKTLEGIGLYLGARELWEKFSGAVEAADQMGKLSQKTGVTVEQLSGLQYAAKLSDVGVEGLATGLKKLSTSMFDAASGGRQQQAIFQSLGVSYKNATGNLRDTNAVLLDVADRFSKMKDGSAKAAAAVKLFGKAGTDLIPLLNEGRAGIKDLTDEAERMGIIVSTEMARKAEEFDDNMTRLKESSSALARTIAIDLLPWLNKMIDEFLRGKEIAGGFWAAVSNFGTINPFKNAQENIRTAEEAIASLNRAKQALLSDNPNADTSAFDRSLERQRQRIIYLKERAQQEALALGAGYEDYEGRNPKKATDQRTGSPKVIDTTAVDKVTAFIQQLKEMTAKVGQGEYAMLRMKAASMGAAQAVEPYIVKLQQAKEAQQDLIDRQNAQIASTDNLIAAMNKKDFEDPAKVYDFVKAQKDANAEYDFQTTLLGKTALEQEKLTAIRRIDLAVVEQSKSLGAEATADLVAQSEKLKETVQKSADARAAAERSWQVGASSAINSYIDNVSNAAKQTESLLGNAFKGMEDALVNFVKTGKLDFKSLADSIISDMIRIYVQRNVLGPLIGTASKPGILSQGLDWITNSVIGGARASGGPVSAGTSYLVGERGPELFTPGASGAITPNGAMGGVTVQNIYNIDATGAAPGVEQNIRRAISESEDRAVNRAVDQVRNLNQRGQLRIA